MLPWRYWTAIISQYLELKKKKKQAKCVRMNISMCVKSALEYDKIMESELVIDLVNRI